MALGSWQRKRKNGLCYPPRLTPQAFTEYCLELPHLVLRTAGAAPSALQLLTAEKAHRCPHAPLTRTRGSPGEDHPSDSSKELGGRGVQRWLNESIICDTWSHWSSKRRKDSIQSRVARKRSWCWSARNERVTSREEGRPVKNCILLFNHCIVYLKRRMFALRELEHFLRRTAYLKQLSLPLCPRPH